MRTNIQHIVESTARLVLEDRGSKNLSQARAYLEKSGVQDPQKVIDTIRHDIPNIRLPRKEGKDTYKFLFAACRFFTSNQLNDADAVIKFNQVLPYIASDEHMEEYDRNLNNLSLKDVINRFTGIRDKDIESQKAQSKNNSFNGESDYDIVPIDSFEEAQKYANYTDWCITRGSENYNRYTHGRRGRFYFCLKHGYQDVQPYVGKNCPLDEYGLSMIAVSITEEGDPNTITCRWNHAYGGNDNIMNVQQLESVIKKPFFDTFLPFTEEELEKRPTAFTYDEYQELVFENSVVVLKLTDGTVLYRLLQDLDPEDMYDEGYQAPDPAGNDYAIADEENRYHSSFNYYQNSVEERVDGVYAILKEYNTLNNRTVCLAYDDQGEGDVYEYVQDVNIVSSKDYKYIAFFNEARGGEGVIWNTPESGGKLDIKHGHFLELKAIDLREVNTLVEVYTIDGNSLIDIFTDKVLIHNRMPKNGVNFEYEWIDSDEGTGWVVETEDGMRILLDGEGTILQQGTKSDGERIWSDYGIKLIKNFEGRMAYLPIGKFEPTFWFDELDISFEDTGGRFAVVGVKKDGVWSNHVIMPNCLIYVPISNANGYSKLMQSEFGRWFALKYNTDVRFFRLDLSEIKPPKPVNTLIGYNNYCVMFKTEEDSDNVYMFSLKDGHLLIPEGTPTRQFTKMLGDPEKVRINGEEYSCATESFVQTESVRRMKQRFVEIVNYKR